MSEEKTQLEPHDLNQRAFVTCPQCKRKQRLTWNDYSFDYGDLKQNLMLRGCPSGGIYDVTFACRYCSLEEEL